MSGHSKWSTIKRQKGAADVKRSMLFTKLSSAITLAVRQGGGVGDPEGNFRLRLAVEAARASNMPKENIERAIERASGKQAANVEEVVYEGFGPGGFSVIVEAITDNKMRTTPIVKSSFDKNGGNMGNPGSVAYQFAVKGFIAISKLGTTVDEVFLIAADNGAEDVEEIQNEIIVYTKPEELNTVREALVAKGYIINEAQLIRKPIVTLPLSEPSAVEKAISFVEKLEELDDVQHVYTNLEIPDDISTS